MHTRRPTACHQQRIAIDTRADIIVIIADLDGCDAVPAIYASDAMVKVHVDAKPIGLVQQSRGQLGAHVDDRLYTDTRFCQGEDILPAAVMRGHQRDRRADRDAVAKAENLCGGRQHHAGRIVAVKNERPFNRTLRKDHFTGPHTP